MKTVITCAFGLALFALAAFGQDANPTPPPAPAASPVAAASSINSVSAGLAYNGASGNGWVSASIPVGSGIASVTTYDITVASRKPLTFQSSVRTGIDYTLRTIGPLTVHAVADAGAAATGSSLGSAFSGGGYGSFDLGPRLKHLNLIVGGRELKTTNAIGVIINVGIGHGF